MRILRDLGSFFSALAGTGAARASEPRAAAAAAAAVVWRNVRRVRNMKPPVMINKRSRLYLV